MFWVYLLVYAAAFLLAELFKPKPEVENARPSGLGDFNFPTATEGRPVPLLWGTCQLSAPNIIWYGDLRTERIRDKIKTGMFSSKKVTVGYKYYVGMQFALCRGPADGTYDGLMQILVDDEALYEGFTGSSPQYQNVTSGTLNINQPNFFGEDAGGISGNFTIFPGTTTQARSTYLEGVITQSPNILPAYRGTVHIVAEQIYIGNNPSLRQMKFVYRRIPDGLSLGADALVNDLDANPMNVLYEILTNVEWGLAQPSGNIDTTTLATIGATLAAEGNGFSALMDTPRKVEQVIQEIERQVDGVLLRDTTSGKYTFKLIRESDIPSPISSLLHADENNCEKVEFSRSTWSETSNNIRVQYADPQKNYATSYGIAQDLANSIIQGGVVTSTQNFMGVKNAALANYLAWRDLRNLATPLAKVTITVNREFYTIKPGDLFLLSWDVLGLSSFLVRATRVNYGELLNNKITIDAVEDIFTTQAASFGDPIATSWTPPTQVVTAQDIEDNLIFETPRLLQILDPDDPTLIPRITTVPRLTGSAGDEYKILTQTATTKAGAVVGTFDENDGFVPNFVKAGILRTETLDLHTLGGFGQEDLYIDPFPGESLADLIDDDALTVGEINNLYSLVYITPASVSSPDDNRDYGEFVMYTWALESIGGSPQQTGLKLQDCWRGALDSVIKKWPAGSIVWFLNYGGVGISSEAFSNATYPFVSAKILPSTQESGTLGSGSATPTNVIQIASDGYRVDRPLPPRYATLSSSIFPATQGFSMYTTTYAFAATARNWRANNAYDSVRGYNDDGTSFNPTTYDAGDGLSFILRAYAEGSPGLSPTLIFEEETDPDVSGYNNWTVRANDLIAPVIQGESFQLRFEIHAKHRTTSPGMESREPVVWTTTFNESTAGRVYDSSNFLGRIPYGTVVSPGIQIVPEGSPGSPRSCPQIQFRFSIGAYMNENGGGENGKLYLLVDDGSPAQLIVDGSATSPQSVYYWTLENGSPSEWAYRTINILHYHNTGRPLWFHIVDTVTDQVYAWGVLEPNTSTLPTPSDHN